MSERSKFNAMLNMKCPRCRQGDMFVHKSFAYNKFSEMHEKCPNCGLRFEQEPGFFYGAMYISYAFSVALMAASFVLSWLIFGEINVIFATALIVLILIPGIPFLFRYSRVLFIYWFGSIPYERDLSRDQ